MHASANSAVATSPSPSARGPNAAITASSRRGGADMAVRPMPVVSRWRVCVPGACRASVVGRAPAMKKRLFFSVWRGVLLSLPHAQGACLSRVPPAPRACVCVARIRSAQSVDA